MKSVPNSLKWRENLKQTFFAPPPHSGDQNKIDWKWKKMKSVQNHPKWQDDLNGT